MRNKFFTALVLVWLCTSHQPLAGQEPINQPIIPTNPLGSNTPPGPGVINPVVVALNDLVGRINEKITQQKTNETDLADNLKEFDVLFERFKNAPDNDRAQILTMKAQLYLLVLNQPEKALEVFKQFKRDLPGMQLGGNTDEVIRVLEKQVASVRIQRTLVPGAKFPEFSETDLAGKPLSLAQYSGKVVLVDFWATWCVPCLIELPHVIKTYERHHRKGFEVVGVSLDEDRMRLEGFIKDKSLPWPQFFDGKRYENKLAVQYGIQALPASYLIDRKGKILAVNLRGDQLERAVALEMMPGFQRMLTSGAQATDGLVRGAPYSSLAVVFVAGLAIGALLYRRRQQKQSKAKA